MPISNEFPMVSLLVAMRNEERYIERCLDSILAQDYPADRLEVLIFDGQSTDGSWEIVEKWIKDRPLFSLYSNPDLIQSAAWNAGIGHSHGEVISIVSGHSKLSSNYVSKAVETLLRTKADLVGGTVRASNSGYIGETIALAMTVPFGVGNASFRYTEKQAETDTVFMGFCRRTLYKTIGSFDEELVRNQDDEFSYRLRKAGGRIVCNPEIVSYYQNRASLQSLWKQYYQYGFWKVRVLQKHPRQMSPRQFVPPVLVFFLLISVSLALSPVSRPLSFLIPLLYFIANLIASFYTASKRGWRYLPLLPLTFAILHLSYGLGFLVGLVKFWNRWGDKVGKTPVWSSESLG